MREWTNAWRQKKISQLTLSKSHSFLLYVRVRLLNNHSPHKWCYSRSVDFSAYSTRLAVVNSLHFPVFVDGCFIDVNDDDSIKKKHWTKWNKDSMMNDPSAVKSRNTVSGMLDMDLLVWHCRSNLFHNLINLLNDTYWLYWHWFSLSNEENFHSNKVHQAWVYLVLLVVFCISKV